MNFYGNRTQMFGEDARLSVTCLLSIVANNGYRLVALVLHVYNYSRP